MFIFFNENLFFFFSSDLLSLDGGKGGRVPGALCKIIQNICERDRNIVIDSFDLMNTVARVQPNVGHLKMKKSKIEKMKKM